MFLFRFVYWKRFCRLCQLRTGDIATFVTILLLVALLNEISGGALTAVVSVEVSSHEGACTAELVWARLSKSLDLLVGVDLVVLQNSELYLLVLVLNLLWLGVNSLLLLLTTSDHWNNNVDCAIVSQTGLRNNGLSGEIRTSIDETGIESLDRVLGGYTINQRLNGGTSGNLNGQQTDWRSDKDLHLKQPNR